MHFSQKTESLKLKSLIPIQFICRVPLEEMLCGASALRVPWVCIIDSSRTSGVSACLCLCMCHTS